MSKIDRIIKNLETIKSRDSANHKEDCKCELCDSLRLAQNINTWITSAKKLNKKMAKKMTIQEPAAIVLTYIEFLMERL